MALLLSIPLAMHAQGGPATPAMAHDRTLGHAIPVPSARAVRLTGVIVLDGRLDEPAWRDAPPVTEFTQYDPDEGKSPSERTEVRFLFDDDALYVGARMYDSHGAAGVMTRLVRRDDTFDSDYLELVIDGYHDHLSRAFFDVNPSGSINDQLGIGASCCDAGWDPVWQVATRIDSAGWTAEIRIPFNQLRYSRDSLQTWGLQIRRFIKRRQEEDDWSFWKKTDNGGPSRFGHLEGIEITKSPGHLEILPYVVTKSDNSQAIPGDPFNPGRRPSMQAGLDLKDQLTSNLTLDATFNPDFGQVEVDPAVINLSAFETFFPEKRPFFVAGSSVFDFGSFNCFFCSNVESMSGFYSRRVGRAPTGADLAQNNYQFADVPSATTILGAGKITGRTTNGYTVGIIDAVTGEATARVAGPGGMRGTQEVEPLANYFVGRVKRDYLGGDLVLGGILSSVDRHIDSTFAPRLAQHAELVGGDFLYAWNSKVYQLMGSYGVTNVSGDARAITLREEASSRYFQRPDRGRGSGGFLSDRLDTNASSLRGAGAYLHLGKESGDWMWETAVNTRTPGYETNDYAFQQRADYVWYDANLFRYWSKPTSWYRNFYAIIGAQQQQNFEGDVTGRQGQLWFSTTTLQFWTVNSFWISRASVIDDHQLRGGPAVMAPSSNYYEIDVSSDSRRAVVLSGGWNYSWSADGSWSPSANLSAQYRPTSSLRVTFGPSWSDAKTATQYVAAVGDLTDTTFFGSRYVMSALRQKVLALDTRVSVTFTPRMTLEFYAQPFLATGHYSQFQEYVAPRTDARAIYGRDRGTISAAVGENGVVSEYTIDPDGAGPAQPFTIANPDFDTRSLRGNAVFRWEYRPGSVLYFAWTQTRSDVEPFGDFNFTRDRQGLLAIRPENVFLVKASWWMPK
jgi:hypothetical protein